MAASTLSWDADLQSTLAAGGLNEAAAAPAAMTMAKRKRRRDDVKYSSDGKIIVDEEAVQSSGTATVAAPKEEDAEDEGDGMLVYGQGGRSEDSGQKRRRVVRDRSKTQKKPDIQSGTKGGASYQYIKMGKDFSSNWKDARSKSKSKGKGKKSMGAGQMGWKQAKKKRG